MRNKILPLTLLMSAVLVTGCAANGGHQYRADVYNPSAVNRAQEVRTVEIIAIQPAQVVVDNSDNRRDSQAFWAILGAIAGAAIGNHGNHSTSSRVLGGLAGGAVGGIAGSALSDRQEYVNGVQLVYRLPDGRMMQSTQVGEMCEFRTGTAIMASGRSGETRIQPNNPYGCNR